ncbi:CRISPR-associated helicase Cas3' [Clostridium butyricum]|uniref:CRISPR-associated helicase Cas3' n=1 Tax=Clostridium butyricum TaxID=1492 RepID=UPI003467947B
MEYLDVFKKLNFKTLTEIQTKIKNSNNNILILSNCGSGKTEASYFKMLESDAKTLFIEPMRTLANSIQDRCNDYNKHLGLENVTIQHSSRQEDKFLQNKYCVTTIDQILSGYLMLGKQSAMKGKNVLTSNLIFDEIQLFDTDKMLLTTINMLDEINKLNNKFIIMTATMPNYLIDFLKDRYNMDVFVSEKDREDRTTNLFYSDMLDYNKIINYNDKQIIICNTRKQLKEIKRNLPKDRVITFHSVFTQTDRSKLENKIYKYFGKQSISNDKILLTTQIVEVGIDISCNRLYTTACPIDNLVQRDGRCCRWGGIGQVVVFKNEDKIYDKTVVEKTINYINNNNGINFNWDIQKQWVNDILNPFYKDKINANNLKKNKHNFKEGRRSSLIRDIQNVNLIICDIDNISKNDFKRECVSISMKELKNIAETNELYILNKNLINNVKYNSLDIGETICIQGNNCVYDDSGFYYNNDALIERYKGKYFSFQDKKDNFNFSDYINETWLHHALSTKEYFENKLKEYNFNTYINKNLNKIVFFGGLHDLGKLDIEWSKKYKSDEPLAHFPFTKNTMRNRRTHELISGEILKPYINDKIIYNMIIQHHRKLYVEQDNICSEWKLTDKSNEILKDYGFNGLIHIEGNRHIIHKRDIITPYNDEWTTLLYLIGCFMESEIRSISDFITINYK